MRPSNKHRTSVSKFNKRQGHLIEEKRYVAFYVNVNNVLFHVHVAVIFICSFFMLMSLLNDHLNVDVHVSGPEVLHIVLIFTLWSVEFLTLFKFLKIAASLSMNITTSDQPATLSNKRTLFYGTPASVYFCLYDLKQVKQHDWWQK